MMDDTIKEAIENFDALWQRVACQEDGPAAGPEAGPRALEDMLLGLIHEEICAAANAAALARSLSGEARGTLQRYAADARRRLRRLRAEHFIATGVMPGGNEDCRGLGPGRLESLRVLFLRTEALADGYGTAADRADSPELRDVLTAFGDNARRQARELRTLLVESF